MSITALILAGGAGTRLRPLTYHRPKPMVPIANKPILQYQMELLRRHGINDIVLCVGASTDSVRDYFGKGDALGIRIHYSVEDTPLGTAGAIRNAEQFLKDGSVLIMNGDGLVDYDLSAVIGFHKNKNADATIGLMKVPAPTPCGIVKMDDDSRVTSFEEPDKEQKKILGTEADATGYALVNAGVYIISAELLGSIPTGLEFSIEREFFPSVIENDRKVYASLLRGKGLDIGAPSQYLNAHHELLSGRIDAEIAGHITDGRYWVGDNTEIDPSAKIDSRVYIGPGCKIGSRVKITEFTSIGPGCTIGDDSILASCALLENVNVGSGCSLHNCIADSNCRFLEGVVTAEGSVIAAGTTITAANLR